MNKKMFALICMVMAIIVGISIQIYGVTENITFNELSNLGTRSNRESVAQKVLNDTGLSSAYAPEEVQEVRVYFENVYDGPDKEAIFNVIFSPKDSVVGVYTPSSQNKNEYTYVGKPNGGKFFNVTQIQSLPIPNKENNMLLLRQTANQLVGAFEQSSFIEGYLWNNGEFKSVLNTPQNISSTWNLKWDGIQDENPWQRIFQETDVSYTTDPNLVFNLVHRQKYEKSSDEDSVNVPKDDTFSVASERIVAEKFYWSEKWQRFILGEGIEKATNQPVAVLEAFANSPYALLDYGVSNDSVKIQRQDGSQDIVNSSNIQYTQ